MMTVLHSSVSLACQVSQDGVSLQANVLDDRDLTTWMGQTTTARLEGEIKCRSLQRFTQLTRHNIFPIVIADM